MINRGLAIAGVAVCWLSIAVGCVNQSSKRASIAAAGNEAQAVPQPSLAPVSAGQFDELDSSAAGTAAVTRKVQSYSREMEAVLSRRAAPGEFVPSEVKWADPSDFRLGELPRNPAGAVASSTATPAGAGAVEPAIQTSPGEANQVASIGGGANSPVQAVAAAANVPARAEEPATRPASHADIPSAELSRKLGARVRDYPRDVSAHLEYQLLQLILDQQVPQLSALAALPGEDRELITAVLDGLSLFRSTLRADNNTLLSRKIHPLLDMSDRLRSQAELSIPHVGLCRSVKGFGEYEPIEPARFAAMAEHKAILYCEVANFSTRLNEQQRWETELKQELVLYSESGMPVWSDRSETIRDAARTRRHDFFVNKLVIIPKNLSIGRYLLKVTIVDVQGDRVAEASVPIVIAAE